MNLLQCALALALFAWLGVACGEGPSTELEAPRRAARPALGSGGRTWALLINGGGKPAINYQSHLLHVRELAQLLLANGIPGKRILVFSSDGTDPAPDLAVRDLQTEKYFWLIEDLAITRSLHQEIRYENSTLEGLEVHPATKEALTLWFELEGERLESGDTLLFYVTDHGTKNKEDLDNNAIVLWGEDLSVNEFKRMIARLPEGVRVVSLMSQCFSGSFANAIYSLEEPGRTVGDVCGFYSSSASRRAYGCYPENRGKQNVGHSFRFFEAIRVHGNLVDAHERVLLTDRTPDVPNRSSDHFLERLLRGAASDSELELEAFVDALLETARAGETRYDEQFARIDHVGQAFGSFSPRSLEELAAHARQIPGLGRELRSYARRWKTTLDDLKRENLRQFYRVYPSWLEYVKPGYLESLEPAEKRRLTRSLLVDLVAFTDLHPARSERLEALRTISTEAQTASYRMNVRRGAVLRIRSLLLRIAGLVYLERHRGGSARAAFKEIETCEALHLGGEPIPTQRERALPPPFPPLVEESELLSNVLPGWMGIEFKPLPPRVRERMQLERGAVRVTKVFPGSPADDAGIRVGDIVIGPPGAPFLEPRQIREWTMTSIVGEERPLILLRHRGRKQVRIRIGAAPI